MRYTSPTRIGAVLEDLQKQGVVKDARAMQIYSFLTRHSQTIPTGTFSFAPGMSAGTILSELSTPVRQNVRIPGNYWANRTAHYLANKQVVDADEYMNLVRDPRLFRNIVSFPITGIES